MLVIEVFKENETINTRTLPAKDDRPARILYEQTAYVYLGGKFPVEMKVSLEEGQPAYKAGKYTPHQSSYQVNNFGGLELRRFGFILEPLEGIDDAK